jgi:hypothetical protein
MRTLYSRSETAVCIVLLNVFSSDIHRRYLSAVAGIIVWTSPFGSAHWKVFEHQIELSPSCRHG